MARAKISITVSEDLLARVDREARRRPGGNRSAVIEEWLRRGARARAGDVLREETVAYYDSLPPEDRADDEGISRAGGEAAGRLAYDG